MPTYKDWELYEVLPDGWKIDKHCGSPLFGYDFCTDGKSIINGGKRALVKTETKKAIMKEFHSDNLHLFNCDNIELMKTFKDKEFDLAIVDPPYAVGASDGTFGNKGVYTKRGKKLEHYANHNKCPDKDYFEELFRVSKNQIIWGSNYYPQFLYHSGAVIWDKKLTGSPMSDCEIAFQSFNKLVKKCESEWNGFLKGNDKSEKIHPNQKPIHLYEWILHNYAKNGDSILDTHLGSASIAIAIENANNLDKMNLTLTATELHSGYFDKSVERIKVFKMQKTLF